jgi:fused signal recognition particle receptor
VVFGAFKKLVQGLTRTRDQITASLGGLLGVQEVDEAALEDLEAALLGADLGPTLTAEVLEGVRQRAKHGKLAGVALRDAVAESLRQCLDVNRDPPPAGAAAPPRVVFVVGVNGGGKTTTVGKLASRERSKGHSVLVVAADTFRAAAIDQLERWAARAGVDVLKQTEGADPSAVVFDGVRAARARGIDLVVVDTAGRLHTKSNLMAELTKMSRVAAKEAKGAPHEVLLVVDATTGQNGLVQAREFQRALPVTGVILTKLDGTAKGGVALGIQRAIGAPVRYVGVGETVDDLLDFDADAFVQALLGTGEAP